jgi:hypothetical protein
MKKILYLIILLSCNSYGEEVRRAVAVESPVEFALKKEQVELIKYNLCCDTSVPQAKCIGKCGNNCKCKDMVKMEILIP